MSARPCHLCDTRNGTVPFLPLRSQFLFPEFQRNNTIIIVNTDKSCRIYYHRVHIHSRQRWRQNCERAYGNYFYYFIFISFPFFAQQQTTNKSEERPLPIVKGNRHWRCVSLVNILNISLSVCLLRIIILPFYLSF